MHAFSCMVVSVIGLQIVDGDEDERGFFNLLKAITIA